MSTSLILRNSVILLCLTSAVIPTEAKRCDTNADCPNSEDEYFCDGVFSACMSCRPWCHPDSAKDRQEKCKEFCPIRWHNVFHKSLDIATAIPTTPRTTATTLVNSVDTTVIPITPNIGESTQLEESHVLKWVAIYCSCFLGGVIVIVGVGVFLWRRYRKDLMDGCKSAWSRGSRNNEHMVEMQPLNNTANGNPTDQAKPDVPAADQFSVIDLEQSECHTT